MVDLNVKFRKRMRVAAVLTLALGVALDVGMFLLTHWIFPPISIFSIFCAYIGLVFVTIGDVAGVRYMELRPDGVMQKYLVWQRLIPWEDFQQIGARELGSRMGKEYCHSLVFLQQKDAPVGVSELLVPSRAFSTLLVCPDTKQTREYVEKYYGELDFDIS